MTTILLLHGAIGSAAQLEPLEKALQPHFNVHRLSFPGHGGAEALGDFSLPYFASYVHDYCQKERIEKTMIFGYSMGGYVALLLALQQPQLVEGVITLGTKFHWDEATAAKEVKMLQPQVIEEKLPQFAATLEQRHAPLDWKNVLKNTEQMLLNLGKDNALKSEDISRISTPTLIMLGDRDKMVSLEETVAVYKQLPVARLAVLPATPHPIEAVSTGLLAYMINSLLA